MLVEKIKAKINEKLSESKRNVSAAERLAGLPENTIRNILDGVSKNPKIETLQAISRFLGCSLDELVGNITKPAVKAKPDLPIDYELFASVFELVNTYLNKNNIQVTLDQIIFLLEQSYDFCYTKRSKQIDREFVEWLIDTNHK